MANPFSKFWKYFMARSNNFVDTHADPKIQIKQALGEELKQHGKMEKTAGSIVGNKYKIQMEINRQETLVATLKTQVTQALTLAENALNEGNEAKANQFNASAESFSDQLVAAETHLVDLQAQHEEAVNQSAAAMQSFKDNSTRIQQRRTECDQLLNQADGARMIERTQAAQSAITGQLEAGYSDNVPTMEQMRDKIERRVANAMGANELLQGAGNPSARLSIESATVASAGSARLEQIRREMNGGAASIAPGITVVEPEYIDVEAEPVPDGADLSDNEMLNRLNGKPDKR